MKTFALIVVLAIIGSVVSRIVYRVGPLTDEEIDRANVIIDYFYKQWQMDWTKIRKPCKTVWDCPRYHWCEDEGFRKNGEPPYCLPYNY